MHPVRAVGFDVYGVMTPVPYADLETVAVAQGAPPGAITAAFATPRWLEDVQRGRVAVATYVEEISRDMDTQHGASIEPALITARLDASLEAVPAMVELVREVRRTCCVGLLTNNIRESPLWAPALDEQLFDVIVDASSGARKPDPAAFAALVDAFGVPAHDVAFVDDSAANLRPAAQLGLRPVLFADPESCRRALAELGVDVGIAVR